MQDMGLFEKGLYRTPNDQYNRQHDDQLWDLGIPYFSRQMMYFVWRFNHFCVVEPSSIASMS